MDQPEVYTVLRDVELKVRPGLVMRTSSEFTKECKKYPGKIFLYKQEEGLPGEGVSHYKADGKNIIDVLMLAAGTGSKMQIHVEGDGVLARHTALRLKSGLETDCEYVGLNFDRYTGRKK